MNYRYYYRHQKTIPTVTESVPVRGRVSYAAEPGGATQGDTLSVVFYGVTLSPLEEEPREADLGILSPFYAYYAELERRSAQLKAFNRKGTDQGCLPETAKSLFIADYLEQEEAAKREFSAEGMNLNFTRGSWYLGPI